MSKDHFEIKIAMGKACCKVNWKIETYNLQLTIWISQKFDQQKWRDNLDSVNNDYSVHDSKKSWRDGHWIGWW